MYNYNTLGSYDTNYCIHIKIWQFYLASKTKKPKTKLEMIFMYTKTYIFSASADSGNTQKYEIKK